MVIGDYTPGEALLEIAPNSRRAVQIRRFELLKEFVNKRKQCHNLLKVEDLACAKDSTVMYDLNYLTKKQMIVPYSKAQLIKHRNWQLTRLGLEIYTQAAKLMPSIKDLYKRSARI